MKEGVFGVGKKLVGAAGIEPATLCSQSRCATRLRYAPTQGNFIVMFSIKVVRIAFNIIGLC
jgi:hypothetical protein